MPRSIALALALALVAGGAPAGIAPAGAAQPPTLVAAVPGRVAEPRTDGTVVVWTVVGADRSDVVGARLADNGALALTPGPPGSYHSADVDGGVAVWIAALPSAPAAVQAHNLATGVATTLASGAVAGPAVARPWVAWLEAEGETQTLKARDLRVPAAPAVVVRRGVAGFSLAGAQVTWLEVDPGARPGQTPQTWRLYTRQLAAADPVLVAEGMSGGVDQGVSLPSSFVGVGDRVVYVLGGATGTLLVADLRTGERRGLATDAISATFDGRYVFFDRGVPGRGTPIELRGYDLATDSDFVVTGDVGAYGGRPDTQAGVLVWQQGAAADRMEVHAAALAAVLPSARRTPDASGSDAAYFPVTGHSLRQGFRYFWERNGGLPVFGYPLTEEFQQRNADTGAMHTVQFIERQRFEYHPEHAGTPYETLLGRLGAEDAARREDLRGLWAFNPIAADAEHPPGCRYLPEARHRLCGEFRPYWEGHGLELGDPGVSYREAVALFGYPISEEFVDPATGLITQYFERARFEYHPDLAAGRRVLLGRLAADRLAASGW
jgi:hypothetical protein